MEIMDEGSQIEKKYYIGYMIKQSQKDKEIFRKLTVTNQKKIWFGLLAILEIQVEKGQLNAVIEQLQHNMVSRIGLKKQEFYLHFYCGKELIVVYRNRVFHAASDRSTWKEAIDYGRSLGIVEKQLDFLTPLENKHRYFTTK